MDYLEDIAITIILRILKDSRKAKKFEAALFKIHALIESVFPELGHPSDGIGGSK